MKTTWILIFCLCAALSAFWPQSGNAGACAALASELTSDSARRVPSDPRAIFQQLVSSKFYFKCLQLRGRMAAASWNAASSAGTYASFGPAAAPITVPVGITSEGTIAGYYIGADDLVHSFVRARDGALTLFDPPGATCGLATSNTCSSAAAINQYGVITGYWQDASNALHGYLRARDGAFITFDPPGSVLSNPAAINVEGAVTGSYFDAISFTNHGFLRTPYGTYVSFDAPGSASYTVPVGIAPEGAIVGNYEDASGAWHGFLRASDGALTSFDPPGSTYTQPNGINAAGAITGFYLDTSGAYHGFLRAVDGAITSFDAPGVNYGTFATAVNVEGAITGYYILSDFSAQHGFLRDRNGSVSTFDFPGSPGTSPTAINPMGVITGWSATADFAAEAAFVRTTQKGEGATDR
jgi:hypothetical protein